MVDITEAEDGTDAAATGEGEVETLGEGSPTDDGENEDKTPIDISNVVYKNVFKKDKDEEVSKAVRELYDDELNEEMATAAKATRLPFLCVVALDGDKAIGISTIMMEPSQALWVKIGFFRCIVRTEYRRRGIATQLVNECKKVLAAWSEENPDANLKAMGVYTHLKLLGEKSKQPVCNKTGLTLVGYDNTGLQIRLAWFDNARVKY